ncbi:MAG: polyprenyl synthetase family protein [DPANN group archaeon]|nr:polyprenyl synthetase family protein [DPANN group archaeon]
MKDFKEVLMANKPIIWEEVQKYLIKESLYGFDKLVNDYPTRQGKYGRGSLILMACEAFGGDIKKAVTTAAAMQMSEDWLLVHDDYEDDSEERRGKPALHKIYGNELSVNAGDYMHFLMWKILFENRKNFTDDKVFKIIKEFERFLDITIRGQHIEMCTIIQKDIETLTDEDFIKIAFGKTSEYTISGPLRLGAIIADQDETMLNKISEFGIPLGIGFQIRDDILDVVNTGSASWGKKIGGDIREGKRTLLLIHLINNTDGEEHKNVVDIMKKERVNRTDEDIKYIIELMKTRGSVAYAEKKAEEYAEKSIEIFNKYFSDIPNKEDFQSAINFFTMKRDV